MSDNILARIAELHKLDAKGLRDTWRKLYNAEPPKYSNANNLIKRLSYRIQELAYGGDSEETKARLAEYAKHYFAGKNRSPAPAHGTVLTREYHGVEHQVAVLEEGAFQYNGCKYRSLSGIAKHITGMSWNGHDFFRLKPRKSKSS